MEGRRAAIRSGAPWAEEIPVRRNFGDRRVTKGSVFWIHLRINRSSSMDTASGNFGKSFRSGSSAAILTMISVGESPRNAAFPTSISYTTQPNAHTSVRTSTDFQRACSGEYARLYP